MAATYHAASLVAFAMFATIDVASPRALASQSWKVSAQPTVVIGADGDSTAQFTAIAGVARFGTGEIAVVNVMPPEIRLFSPAGKFVRRIARPGSGPGELQSLFWLGSAGDSLLTYDVMQARITVFDVPRSKVSTIPFLPTKTPGRMLINGFFANGSWLIATWPPPLGTPHPDGPYRDTTALGLWRSGTDGMRPLGSFTNFSYYAHNVGGRTTAEFDQLTGNTSFLTVGNELWVGIPDARSIAVYEANGKLAREVRVPFEPVRFSAAELQRARDRRLATLKRAPDSARASAMFDQSKRSLGGPAFARLLLGRDGRVWVESFRVDRGSSAEYVALDRAGRVVGRLTSPPGVRFSDFGTDYALGIRKDENDVETVELFTIVR